FTAGDAGVHTFANLVTMTHAGAQTLRVDDGQLLATLTVTVSPAAFRRLALSAPGSVAAGGAFSVTVAAQDQYQNAITGYAGTVHFTSSDGQAALPADYTFLAGDQGVHTFSAGVVLKTSGGRSVTVADAGAPVVFGSALVTVSPSSPRQFLIAGPVQAAAGRA